MRDNLDRARAGHSTYIGYTLALFLYSDRALGVQWSSSVHTPLMYSFRDVRSTDGFWYDAHSARKASLAQQQRFEATLRDG